MKETFTEYTRHYAKDIPASLVVFLVALPLCLGIALASGAPLFSGLITGIIAGIVVGALSQSHTSVSGPAAGLTVIVFSAIAELGSFELFLLAVVLGGVFQLILGLVKAGIIGLYFPSSVIKGMLAAIGLILILKQLPHFLGVDMEAFGEMAFADKEGGNTFTHFFYALQHIHPGAAIIGFVSLGLMILWERPFIKQHSILGLFPGALIAVLSGVGLHLAYIGAYPAWTPESQMLVTLPNINSIASLQKALAFPDWTGILNPVVWKTAAVIAIVASLETLLSIEAVDKLDPHKRHSPKNAELRAQGIGNIIAGMIGGLPMTSVIVRSSANVASGGETKMSAIYHGLLLLGSVLLIPGLMGYIPLASLAAVLIFVGFKLSKPSLYRQQFKIGYNQFMPFIITIIAILLTDLLVGISIGMVVGVFFILRANYRTPYHYDDEEVVNGQPGKRIKITLSEHVSFINKASLQTTLDHLPDGAIVTIDGYRTTAIDPDALELIYDFVINAPERDIKVTLQNCPHIEGMTVEEH
ncbi:MAG: SulP family inorganic anion transporter [Phaeodactylibacter xiamenensis]|uniref:Membrane protein n=1 Tax=Phaeodactylibacter xiamenensis TaxID=1524460 RepID=A0A098S3Z4_9BACT|nr:SulP family inorganic anion transporter [Phaeodactylibacter xiamenensis]KGE87099.1 membrane protein [Phaeodactylibacter xiamenensis]MCR9053725.1 SulP family inorganic anion transporter [bacterium]